MITLLQKKVNVERSTMAFIWPQFCWPYLPGIVLHGPKLPPSILEPEGRAESCPDDLKSTDFCIPFILLLYQIDHLSVK